MAMKVATLARLGEFLTECRALFASQTEVAKNDSDIETYVLNIDYTQIEFDTSEIIEDIVLDENEAMLLSSNNDILVDINGEYIIVEEGE